MQSLLSDAERRRTVTVGGEEARDLCRALVPGHVTEAQQRALGIELRHVLDAQGKLVQERPILLVFHDEMTAHAERRNQLRRVKPGLAVQPMRLPPKSEGPSCMVSGFMCLYGVVHYTVVTCSGDEGWWNGEAMHRHATDAVLSGAAQYPAFELRFYFDHSSGHDKSADLALSAGKCNKYPGGTTGALLRAVVHPVTGERIELNEKLPLPGGGFYWHAKPLPAVYTALTGMDMYEGKSIVSYSKEQLVKIVDALPAFKAERSALVQLIEDSDRLKGFGFKCLSLPAYHCELSPIELLWSWLKADIERLKDGTRATLVRILKQVLDGHVTPKLASSWFAHCDLHFQLYGRLLVGGCQSFALVHVITGAGSKTGLMMSKRKVTTVMPEGAPDAGAPAAEAAGAVDGLAALLDAAVAAVVPLLAAGTPRATGCVACLLAAPAAAPASAASAGAAPARLLCARCPAFVHTAAACYGRGAPPAGGAWLCNACEGKVDAARHDAVAALVAGGQLGKALDDPASAAELSHAAAVLLANNPDPFRAGRLERAGPLRARFARVLQDAHEACLAAERPFSLRQLLLAATPQRRGILFTRPA